MTQLLFNILCYQAKERLAAFSNRNLCWVKALFICLMQPVFALIDFMDTVAAPGVVLCVLEHFSAA